MSSYNRVVLMGNLTRDPEVKYLQSGMAVANLGLAMNRTYTEKSSGESKEEVCFIDLEAWDKTAETIGEYLSKGRRILVEGRLRQQTWQDKDTNANRSKHVVVVDNFKFIDRRDEGSGEEQGTQQSGDGKSQQADFDDTIPF